MIENITNWDTVKDKLRFYVKNVSQGHKIANGIYETKGDLTIEYVIAFASDMSRFSEIPDTILREWGVSTKDVIDQAKKNVYSESYAFMPIGQALFGQTFDNPDNPLYVVATLDNKGMGRFGARAIMVPEVQRRISREMGGDFIILPSSKHEVLVLPKDFNSNMEDMQQMVQDINSAVVSPDDFLSNNIYLYDAKDKDIKMVTGKQKSRSWLQSMKDEEDYENEEDEEQNIGRWQ